MKAVVGARIITVTGPEIPEGVIVIGDDGRIAEVGSVQQVRVPKDAEVIEAHGLIAAPGFVDAHSHIGVVPEGIEWEYADVNDFYSPVTPHMRAIDALDPYDPAFTHAVQGGVTTVYTGPGSANVIGGIGAVIKTWGRSPEDMVVIPEAALKMALGPKRPREYRSKMPYPTTRMGTVAVLRTWLRKAREFAEGRLKPDKLDEEEKAMLEVLVRVLRRELIAKIHLSTSPDEILAVLRLIREFGLRATIDHVFGGHLMADEIARSGVPVIYGPPMIARVAAFFRYVDDRTPAILYRKGVLVSVMTDHPVIPQKHLRTLAATAVKHGLSPNEALRLITINPAKAMGIDDRVGSIEPGKDADIVLSRGHPVKPSSRIEKVLVRGEVVFSSR
ncbi:MAG: amidohydrolase [Thermoprotei archaeon]|nr:MAG: amidohydrolase [Thermoprotei archaeon]